MVYRGIVSSIESVGTRVILPDKNNTVTAPLPSADGLGALTIGSKVAVVFFTQNFQNGLILAKY